MKLSGSQEVCTEKCVPLYFFGNLMTFLGCSNSARTYDAALSFSLFPLYCHVPAGSKDAEFDGKDW